MLVCVRMCVRDIVLWGSKPSRQPCLLAGKHSWTSDYCSRSPSSDWCQPIAHQSVTPDALCVFTCARACVYAGVCPCVYVRLRVCLHIFIFNTNIKNKWARHSHSHSLLIHPSNLCLSMGSASSWHCSILYLAALPTFNTRWQHVHTESIFSSISGALRLQWQCV